MSIDTRDPFDPVWLRSLIDSVFDPIGRLYFRPRLVGARRIPSRGPLILAANHSGNAFPYDAMVLDALLWRRDRYGAAAKFRSVFEKELALTWWMRPFGIDDFWRRGGGIDLTFDNFDRLLARGERVVYYPEGVPGIGKGFARRYRLQRFSTSFVALAARRGATVLPVHVVNGEWVVPFNYTFGVVDRLVQRAFRVPFLPLPAGLVAATFPWMWYLTLPARLVYVVGDPIDVAGMLRQAGARDPARADRPALRIVADRIRETMQRDLDRLVERWGRRPYHARSLLRALRRARRERLLHRVLPTGWPAAFVRHERDRARPTARSRLGGWLRDWDLAGYYLPLGWLLLRWARERRRPPYGYRGLDPDVRRSREGRYVWHLAERPLPPHGASQG